jgi:hypothetical protein
MPIIQWHIGDKIHHISPPVYHKTALTNGGLLEETNERIALATVPCSP